MTSPLTQTPRSPQRPRNPSSLAPAHPYPSHIPGEVQEATVEPYPLTALSSRITRPVAGDETEVARDRENDEHHANRNGEQHQALGQYAPMHAANPPPVAQCES